jgi:hypothetical protein
VELLFGLALLVVFAVPLAVAIARSNELFVLRVEDGQTRAVRGRVPQRLLDDLADVVRRPKVSAAQIKVIVEDQHPRVVVTRGELPAGQLQALRNVVGTWPLAKIRAGGRVR